MKQEYVIEGRDLHKEYKHFTLDIPALTIPRGFATALIGENGAGKTTLIDMIEGLRPEYKGSFRYFDSYDAHVPKDEEAIKTRIGYTSSGAYYIPGWSIGEIEDLSELLFPDFDDDEFCKQCCDMGLFSGAEFDRTQKVQKLSDGSRVKLMLAGVLARRETELLLLDEPASPLDPLMREKLCDMIREYLLSREGRSVFFSTHNISDMEQVTDYAIIMGHGVIAEQGFVEDLKEKYILVKGEKQDSANAQKYMFSFAENNYGFEGICLSSDLDKLAGMDITTERPTLFQISVAVMKKNSFIR